MDDDGVETLPASPAVEQGGNETRDLWELEDIMDSVMGRQWFQLCMDNQVDDEMVEKRWGRQALEMFRINRDMVRVAEAGGIDQEMMEAAEIQAWEKAKNEPEKEIRIRNMSSSSTEGSGSSGAKAYPEGVGSGSDS